MADLHSGLLDAHGPGVASASFVLSWSGSLCNHPVFRRRPSCRQAQHTSSVSRSSVHNTAQNNELLERTRLSSSLCLVGALGQSMALVSGLLSRLGTGETELLMAMCVPCSGICPGGRTSEWQCWVGSPCTPSPSRMGYLGMGKWEIHVVACTVSLSMSSGRHCRSRLALGASPSIGPEQDWASSD